MPAPFIIGWEEWVALPGLGLPAIKAKVDTGARTSALHAHNIEPFGPASAPLVRFNVHPIAGKTDIEVTCSAPVVDRRDVTSSNGERETRYVILTQVRIGTRTWPIEVTLTNRENMAYRMLLGRQAIQEDMFVDPASSFRQPKLSYKPYKHLPSRDPIKRSLRIAMLAADPAGPGTTRIMLAARERGHVVELIPAADVALTFDGLLPGLVIDDSPMGHFDIVIPRFDPMQQPGPVAILRQFELMGSVSLNPGNAMALLAVPTALRQTLFASGIRMTGPAHVSPQQHSPAGNPQTNSAHGPDGMCVLVVGQSAVAVRLPPRTENSDPPCEPNEIQQARRMAVKAARALNLRLATINIKNSGDGHIVTAVSGYPWLSHFAEATGIAVENNILKDAEGEVRSWVRHANDESGR